jgi:beta-galactosidase
VADGKWHHLVGTYDGGQVCLYVDGKQAGGCAKAASIFYQPDQVAIGRDRGAADGYFTGQIDDVSIYSAALSSQQVSAHYAAANK